MVLSVVIIFGALEITWDLDKQTGKDEHIWVCEISSEI